MSGVNKVILVGNLGADPDVRHLDSGAAVAQLSLATSEKYTDKSTGEVKEQTEWHRLVMWRGLAEVAEKYLRKGAKIYVEGKLVTRSWEKDGATYYTTEIVVKDMQMLGSASGGGNRPPAPSEEPGDFFTPTDDLPF